MQFSRSLKLNHVFRRLYRVGLTVGVKLGHAVVRNRIRRRLREIYRLHEGEFLPGWDLVIVARSRAVTASYQQLERSYLALAAEAGILREAEA